MPELKLSREYWQTCGQRKAILCWVGRIPVKTLAPDCVERIVGELPIGNRSAILCLFHGDKHIPFLHASNDGTAKFLRMQGMIGQTFDVIIVDHIPQMPVAGQSSTGAAHEAVKPDAKQEEITEVLGEK